MNSSPGIAAAPRVGRPSEQAGDGEIAASEGL